jgi:hypothetical protein
MALTTNKQANVNFKREGTSQTFGQLVIFPSKKDGLPIDPKIINRSPKDIVVRLIPSSQGTLTLSKIVDTERSKISLAAVSDNKSAVINLSESFARGSLVENSVNEINNISSVFQNIQDYAIVVGGSKGATELQKILKESAKVDLFVTLKSKESEIVDYNNLKDVDVSSKFVYNFFTPDETDISSQEDQSQDPLLKNDIFNVPRYVKLTWDVKKITEALINTENDFLKVFPAPKGVIGGSSDNFKNSYATSLQKINPVSSEGRLVELIDVHNLDTAFSSINNASVFTNTLNLTISTALNKLSINSLPIFGNLASTLSFLRDPSLIRATVPNASFSDMYMSSSAPSLDPSSKLSLSVLAETVSDVSIERAEPTGFDSLPEFLGIQYVGYVIYKQRLDKSTGEWHTTDEYKIVGTDASSFIDTRVAYGEIYRYRMKTILRFTRKEVISEIVTDNSSENMQSIIIKKLKEKITSLSPLFQNTAAFHGRGLNNFNIRKTVLPKEINLFGDYYASFDAERIDIYQKTPGVETINLRTNKNSKLTSLRFLNNTFNVYLPTPQSKRLVQRIVYKSYYYESLPALNWTYMDIFEDDAPPPPHSIKIVPNSLSKQIFISWLRPSDSARDIAAYKIYRRKAFGDAWSLLFESKEMDVNDDGIPDSDVIFKNAANLHIDKNVVMGQKYIYALSCVDIHGIESFLSAQIQAELNPNFTFEREERPLKWVSGSGATPSEVDFVYKKFLARKETIIADSKMKVTVNSKFTETTKNFIIKIMSLDTHERKQYKLTINNKPRGPEGFGAKGAAGITPGLIRQYSK